jgi:hypothetical protein
MFIVVDEAQFIWGSGLTKKEARQDAVYWAKENGPTKGKLRPAVPCSQKVFDSFHKKGAPKVDFLVQDKDGVFCDITEFFHTPKQISVDDFRRLPIPYQLTLIFQILKWS